MSQQNSTWDSIKTLFDPKTIPFLISQGAGPKLFPVGMLLIGMVLAFIWAYVIAPTTYYNAGFVNLDDFRKQEVIKQVAWELQAQGNSPQSQEAARTQLSQLGNAGTLLDRTIGGNTDSQLAPVLQTLKADNLALDNPSELSKVQSNLFGTLMPLFCIIGAAIIIGGAVIFNMIIPVTLLLAPKAKGGSSALGDAEKERRKAGDAAAAAAAQAD